MLCGAPKPVPALVVNEKVLERGLRSRNRVLDLRSVLIGVSLKTFCPLFV
jgi:hypothetical protein